MSSLEYWLFLCSSDSKASFPFSGSYREYIKVTYAIEYVHRSTRNMTDLNTAKKKETIQAISHQTLRPNGNQA